MKRSPSSHSFSSSSSPSSSSSSSSYSSVVDNQPGKPRMARKRNAADNPSNQCKNGRSSSYRGVTRHRWTGRFEAHLWDKSSWNSIQNKKGRQVYLGAYDNEEDAARAYDLAALKYWGPDSTLNFPVRNYTKELEEMQNASKEEYLALLRRRSNGFSRGASKYRGVARHHHNGRWEARIGRVFGNKYLYLGTFSSQEEAAVAYDLAAIEYRGANAVTNFDIGNYVGHIKNLVTKEQTQQPNSNCFVDSKANEQKDLQQKQQTQQEDNLLSTQSQVSLSELVSSISRSPPMPMMDLVHEHKDPWNLYFDIDSDPIFFPDIPLKEDELLDLFNETGFEDNIVDLIFDGENLPSPSE
ncbi:hypothetical protein Nepgr_009691 [Nepenthes gracilis]|uniref:AP2/ERF domain-containing protein n=1 Tax=Nepenthes gracilis TaxID=150966 RepID=A0AAD3SBQ9_NEPGR|nr:hypothetical protein Nepgr_009691 [Nepenthes gracilis]